MRRQFAPPGRALAVEPPCGKYASRDVERPATCRDVPAPGEGRPAHRVYTRDDFIEFIYRYYKLTMFMMSTCRWRFVVVWIKFKTVAITVNLRLVMRSEVMRINRVEASFSEGLLLIQ
ncbi:unnamed protein product [Euphydryas editha]|uniref:Uncharacterized protein n=1 Tax=Euphydryas editha TaxID=104508 RepID=A0AAU9V8Q7_EUPED|nr:unnamed protein product [Euphydryas editha]